MKNLLVILSIALLFMGLYGCQKNDLTDTVRTALVEEIVEAPMSYFFVDPKYQEKFEALSEEELNYFFDQMAQKVTEIKFSEDKNLYDEYQLTKDELYQIHKAFMKEWKDKSLELYDCNLNVLTTKQVDEVFESVETIRVIELLDKSIQEKAIEFFIYRNEMEVTSNYSSARSSCPGYNYVIPTTIASSGNHQCNNYYNATYVGDSDCDYEFSFNWNFPYSPASAQLYSSTWGGYAVLSRGGINGRIKLGSQDTIRFLIGKGRINWLTSGVVSFKNSLYGNW
ncbi:hypothetical protein [Aureispira sp. CCB-QB1]|uniref:hypothetical protein n=1 Tax=Aureispira sp. CCB-QB1 TaxID=1313421 RepID=UPI0006990BA9|nr:hypothetical protein [Aureispira sp. CCB-QB1]